MKMILKVLALPVLFVVTIACILGKFPRQPFLLCDCSVASGDCRLLHLLHRKGAVDFPGYPCRYGINGNPYNLSVAMGSCKTRNFGKSYQRVYFLIKMGEADGQRIYGALL